MAWSVALGLVRGESSDSEGFSLERYEPMSRLLAEEDFIFLAAQPGYRPEMGAKLRRERRRIFRLYLRELAQDFRSLHREARAMVAESQADHSELVGLLIRQRLVFLGAMTMVELRLAASRFSLGNVDVRGLLESIEAMRLDLARIAAPAPAVS
ncbi:MAG: hypothetical protein ABSB35_28570 [Bryobacteraceae bacterium]|jgi:uncharacterized membrane protein